jgi:hypothetical protein
MVEPQSRPSCSRAHTRDTMPGFFTTRGGWVASFHGGAGAGLLANTILSIFVRLDCGNYLSRFPGWITGHITAETIQAISQDRSRGITVETMQAVSQDGSHGMTVPLCTSQQRMVRGKRKQMIRARSVCTKGGRRTKTDDAEAGRGVPLGSRRQPQAPHRRREERTNAASLLLRVGSLLLAGWRQHSTLGFLSSKGAALLERRPRLLHALMGRAPARPRARAPAREKARQQNRTWIESKYFQWFYPCPCRFRRKPDVDKNQVKSIVESMSVCVLFRRMKTAITCNTVVESMSVLPIF